MRAKNLNPTKLLNRNFMLLWQGQFVSLIGSSAFNIAIMLWLKQITGSASIMGLVMMAYTIPTVILSIIGGVFADRYSRWKIIVFSDLIRGILTTVFAGLVFFGPGGISTTVFALFVLCILSSIVGSTFNPAVSASVPQLVPPEKLNAANSMVSFSAQLTNMLGQGIGGILFSMLGAPLMFLLDGISFTFSAVSEMFIDIPQKLPQKDEASGKLTVILLDIGEGLKFILKNRGLTYLLIGGSIIMFFIMPLQILLPFFVEDYLKTTADWYGYLLAGHSMGSMIGYIIGGIKISGRVRRMLMITSFIAFLIIWGAFGLLTNKILALIFITVYGMFLAFNIVHVMTILQQTTPDWIRGRVLGVLITLSTGLIPLGMGLIGIATDLLGRNIPLMFIICCSLGLIVYIIFTFNRQYRYFLAYEPPQKETSSASEA